MNRKAYYGAAILQRIVPTLQQFDRIIFKTKRLKRVICDMLRGKND